MNDIGVARWSLIAGLSVLMMWANAAAADRLWQTKRPLLESPREKLAPPAVPDDRQCTPGTPENPSPHRPSTTVYEPLIYLPRVGAPGGRETGAPRGPGDALPMVSLLVPDHTGLTIQEQPSLYWYLSQATPHPVVFTFRDTEAVEPIVETQLRPPVQPGVQQLRLADYGIHLQPNIPYRWYVAVVVAQESWSKNIIAGGAIQRIEPSAGLCAILVQTPRGKATHLYAEAGLWYDALMAISELIDAAPHEPVLRRQRAALLEQVGLPEEIAAYDLLLSRAD